MPDARRKNYYSEVKDRLFADLVKPFLKEGGALPSKKDLAKRYNVNVGTLDKALQELSVEGFIQKRMGSGTYVLPQDGGTQGEIGVFMDCHPVQDSKAAEYSCRLDDEVQKALHAAKRNFRHYADRRLPELRTSALPIQLMEDIERKKISVLISQQGNCKEQLEAVKIPVISIGHCFGWGEVSRDMRDVGQQAANLLVDKGCKKIELISAIVHEWDNAEQQDLVNRPLRAGMANALRQFGLPAPECWLSPKMVSKKELWPYEHSMTVETAGYNLCKILFNTHNPDGLVIYTDCLAEGVARALKEMNLKLGMDIQAVVLGNRELDFPWLKGFMRLDTSIEETATALVSLALAAERNEAPREIKLHSKLNNK
ncbi:MAG: GntR family transcriptional regulator [Victivallales bacterium]|jgi:DNA-binding transcriptional regulator YhcF (GntR family)